MNIEGATSILSLVDYQAGSIVSRQLSKSPGGSITVFAFDDGESLSEHTTPHDALIHVVDGVALIEIDGVRHQVGEGQVIHLPGGVPHAVTAEQRFKMMLVMIRARD